MATGLVHLHLGAFELVQLFAYGSLRETQITPDSEDMKVSLSVFKQHLYTVKIRARIHKDSKNPLRELLILAETFLARSLSLKVIQDQSESNSERGKDKHFYLVRRRG